MTTDKLQIAGIRKPAPTLSARRNGCSLAQIEFSPAFCAASFRRCLADLNFLLDQAVEIGDKAGTRRSMVLDRKVLVAAIWRPSKWWPYASTSGGVRAAQIKSQR